MITGKVTVAREAVVQVTIRADGGNELTADAVIDTGFNGYLTLPATTIATLGLASQGARRAILVNGNHAVLAVFRAEVIWDGQPRPIQVLAAEASPLIGMALLQGYRLTLDVRADGAVTIEPLP